MDIREFELQFWAEFENKERVRLLSKDCTFHRWNLQKIDEYLNGEKSLDTALQLTSDDILVNLGNQPNQTIDSLQFALMNIANRIIVSLVDKIDITSLVTLRELLAFIAKPKSNIDDSIKMIKYLLSIAEVTIFLKEIKG